jgi:hypothetical protein
MSEEHLPPLAHSTQPADHSKRKRTPSQYATHIADFKNVPLPKIQNIALTSKRHRSIRFADSEQPAENETRSANPQALRCTLSGGRTYNLTIVPPTKPAPSQKAERRKLRRVESAVSNTGKEEKKEESVCLLDKFLSAF